MLAIACGFLVVGYYDFAQFGGRLAAVDTPVIQVADDGIFCLRMTTVGYYKCYRQDSIIVVVSCQVMARQLPFYEDGLLT